MTLRQEVANSTAVAGYQSVEAPLLTQRAGIARNTLIKIENGDEGVAIGSYFRVLIVLGLEEDLLTIASDDVLGRKLQDAGLKVQKRATKQPQG